MTEWHILAAISGIIGLAVIALRLLFPRPSFEKRTIGAARKAAETGPLADGLRDLAKLHTGRSGFATLSDGVAAFAARIIFARSARHTIDAQYYIWHNDLTGLLLLDALKKAADRGVKVRLLLDDNGISGLDSILAELNRHPNLDVRIYNPFTVRRFKPLGYVFDFLRLNRRMHNKSFTVDGVATIGGGRNIGDEYFDAGSDVSFVDLDLLTVGAVVQDISNDFARYWNSKSACPIERIVDANGTTDALAAALERISSSAQHEEYENRIELSDTVNSLVDGTLPLEWAKGTLVSDPPFKTLGMALDDQLLVGQLESLLDTITRKIDVVSPYFVPGKKGTDQFIAMAKSGVRVRILTNAMEATDVLPVHAGYAKFRKRLLKNGVELYELKAAASPNSKRTDSGLTGSKGASLHAKSFAKDRKRRYIGSFNFDPRSVRLNTEMGIVIDSEAMADEMHDEFDRELPARSYAVTLRNGNLRWREEDSDGTVQFHRRDPNSTMLERAAVRIMGWLPIQWLL